MSHDPQPTTWRSADSGTEVKLPTAVQAGDVVQMFGDTWIIIRTNGTVETCPVEG